MIRHSCYVRNGYHQVHPQTGGDALQIPGLARGDHYLHILDHVAHLLDGSKTGNEPCGYDMFAHVGS